MSPALRYVGRYSAICSPGDPRENPYQDADEKNPVRLHRVERVARQDQGLLPVGKGQAA